MSFWDGSRWIDEIAVRRTPRVRVFERVAALAVGAMTVLAVLLPLVPFDSTRAAGPVLTVSPGSAPAGTKISVVGTQFPARTKVQLEWDGSTTGMPGAAVNANGRFSAGVTVPKTATGTHTLGAVSVVSQKGAKATLVATLLASASFTVGALASPTPTLSATATPPPTAAPTPAPTPTPTATPKPSPTPTPTSASTPAPTATVAPTPAASATSTPPPTTASASSSFVVRCGTQLCLDGQPYRFTGLNIYNANSRDNCWYPLGYADGALDRDLTALGSGQEAFRAWFFQDLATSSGVRDWRAFDQTLAVARAHGMRVIVTLADQWGSCDSGPGGAVYKPDAWYETGYRTTVSAGTIATYRDWVTEVVTRYRNNPTVLAWQLMNEAEVKPSLTSDCTTNGADILRAWATDVSGLVKSLDSNHLVSLGTLGGGQCGTQYTEYKYVHSVPTIDLCEFHDYEPGGLPGDQWNGLAFRLQQCGELDKPLFVGEMGMKDMSLSARAAAVETKFAAQFAAGSVGELTWAYRDQSHGGSTTTDYDISELDPIIPLFGKY